MKCQQWLVSASDQLTHSCDTYDLRPDNDLSRNDQNHYHNNNNNIESNRKPIESRTHSTVISRDHRRSVTQQTNVPCYDISSDRMNSCSDLSGHLTDHSSGKSSTDEDMYGENSSAMAMRIGGQSVEEISREAMYSPNTIGMMAGSSGAVPKSTDAAEIEADKVLGK